MPLNLFYTMVQKSQKWPKTQIKGGGPALIPKTIGNRKRDCAWGCAWGINTTWENLQIEKHKSVRWAERTERLPDSDTYCILSFRAQAPCIDRATAVFSWLSARRRLWSVRYAQQDSCPHFTTKPLVYLWFTARRVLKCTSTQSW